MNSSAHTMCVFLFPSANKNNAYIDLFTNSFKQTDAATDIEIVSIQGDSLWNLLLNLRTYKAGATKNIIHVHWPTVLYGSRFAFKSIFLLIRNGLILLFLKLFLNFKIVWTVHNFYAHDYPHPIIDAIGRVVVGWLADAIMVQQEMTLREYKKKFPHKKVCFIPHGNYIGAYGDQVARDSDLRQSFGFADEDIVLVSLGALSPYKLNEKIVSLFLSARTKNPRLRLLIVGKGKPSYVAELEVLKQTDKTSAIVIQNSFIPDADIPRYLSIADYSIFYYDQSEMTSGGIILSLSYGVPVISRDIPGAEMVDVSRGNGATFATDAELVDILANLTTHPAAHSRDIIGTVQADSWPSSARKLTELYYGLFS